MGIKKHIMIGFLIFLLLVSVIIVVSYGGSYMHSKKALNNFSKLIEQGDLSDISLTIYYLNPNTATIKALSTDDLVYGITADNEPPREKNDINGWHDYKIVVNGSDLEEYIELLSKLSNVALMPVLNKSYLNARIYYVFETQKDGKMFDIAMWGGGENNSIFINGFEVKENDVFYAVIKTFLPESVVKDFEEWLDSENQEK